MPDIYPIPFFVLDVGSGHWPKHKARGSVNIDIKKPRDPPRNFIQADAHHLPIRPDSAKFVLSHQVIEHLENPCAMLREIRQVMFQYGSVTLSTPNPLHWRRLIYAWRNREVETGFNEHINCWTQHEFCNLVKQAGLKPTRIWFDTSEEIRHAKGFRYTLDRWMRRILPKQLGERHIYMEASK